MKKIKYLSFALAVLVLGACSSDETVLVDDTGGKPEWNAEGKGYVNLAISLPTTQGTRGLNDKWDDGTLKEYEVNDATLILFNDEKVHSAYTMKFNFSMEGESDDAITSVARITQEINEVEATGKGIQALVVLNNNGVFDVDTDKAQLKVGGTDMKDKSLEELNNAIIAEMEKETTTLNWHGGGFLMSNALLATEPGGPSEPKTSVEVLTDIIATKIYPKESQADNDPAAIIYVERAEAKVEVTAEDIEDGKGTVTGNSDMSYEIKGWALDNTNKTSKLVRTTDGYATWYNYCSEKLQSGDPGYSQRYRFVGEKPVGNSIEYSVSEDDGTTTTKTKTYYRVYWGEDTNYSPETDGEGLETKSNITDWKELDDVAYCFENTTDLAHMTENNCTRVVVKVEFNGGDGFFIVDEKKEMKEPETDASDGSSDDGTSTTDGSSSSTTGDDTSTESTEGKKEYWSKADVEKEVAARLLKDPVMDDWLKKNVNQNEKFVSEYFTINLVDDNETLSAGRVSVKSVGITNDGIKILKTDYDLNSIDMVALANKNITLDYYADGIAYYEVFVKHFGDDLTPWGKDYETTGIYGYDTDNSASKKYLGRWGMLRNNWYNLDIQSISSLGSPTVEDLTGEYIDNKESYISFRINILPWAVRKQNVEL